MSWLQILGPTLLMVLGGIISWSLKSKIEELRATEQKLREDRLKIYTDILDPYVKILSSKNNYHKSTVTLSSYEYKKSVFNFKLYGSDNTIKAHNELSNYFKKTKAENVDNKHAMALWGNLLLEVRKDFGNKRTKLNHKDILTDLFNHDIDNLL